MASTCTPWQSPASLCLLTNSWEHSNNWRGTILLLVYEIPKVSEHYIETHSQHSGIRPTGAWSPWWARLALRSLVMCTTIQVRHVYLCVIKTYLRTRSSRKSVLSRLQQHIIKNNLNMIIYFLVIDLVLNHTSAGVAIPGTPGSPFIPFCWNIKKKSFIIIYEK